MSRKEGISTDQFLKLENGVFLRGAKKDWFVYGRNDLDEPELWELNSEKERRFMGAIFAAHVLSVIEEPTSYFVHYAGQFRERIPLLNTGETEESEENE